MKQKIKLYKSIIKEISDVIKKHLNESNNDIIYDPYTKFKINLNDIPIEQVRKSYINYKFILYPDVFGKLATHKKVNESIQYTVPTKEVCKLIKQRYNLYDWQCQDIVAYNKVEVIAVIPLLDENERNITMARFSGTLP